MRIGTIAVFALLLTGCATKVAPSNAPDSNQLIGTWQVDLRPKPGTEPYFNEFVVTAVNGRTFTGTFYGSPVSQARINTDWYAVRIAFVTEDQSGAYHHSAVLSGDKLDGLSNSTGRNFLSYWSAKKN